MIAERLFLTCGDWAKHDIQRKRAAIESASLCICVSQATADDLVRFYPSVLDRVRVIHHGAEHLNGGPAGRGKEPPGMKSASVLFVGHRQQYKNFSLVLDAMRRPEWPSNLSLRIVGPELTDEESALIHAYGLTQRVSCLGQLPDEGLKLEYAAACCFIFPSQLEGFGLPLLEAQANGAPVVCSDIPVFREVAGEAALFFDPRLAESLAETVARVLEDTVSHELTEKGYENVMRFCWDRSAEQTLAVYREAVGEVSTLRQVK
jgi:glycosyltransferase involved in cell wall biosynthesis